jgi:Tol biopolymer transport system component
LCQCLCLCAQQCSVKNLRGITPEDYFAFEFISDPNLSPDGKLVAYVVTKIDRAQNRRNSSIWMTATDGSRTPWQFTTSPQTSNSPRWSPDGKSIAFISSRPESAATAAPAAEQPRSQVWLLSMGGGEAKRITNLKNGL